MLEELRERLGPEFCPRGGGEPRRQPQAGLLRRFTDLVAERCIQGDAHLVDLHTVIIPE